MQKLKALFLEVKYQGGSTINIRAIGPYIESDGTVRGEFKILHNQLNPRFLVEVKKYGYCWVYKKDLERSNLTMMHSRNPSTQKRNFSAIEQNEGGNKGKRSKGRISAKRRRMLPTPPWKTQSSCCKINLKIWTYRMTLTPAFYFEFPFTQLKNQEVT